MIRTTAGNGASIAVEVWRVPLSGVAAVLLREPPGLSIGKIELEDRTEVLGVLAEPALVEGQPEITYLGGGSSPTATNLELGMTDVAEHPVAPSTATIFGRPVLPGVAEGSVPFWRLVYAAARSAASRPTRSPG